jgi:hypothetical protein
MHSLLASPVSEEAMATVRIIPDPTFDCTDVTGKVFNDANRDGKQDSGEEGLAGVRLVTANGLVASTDAHGRYHITCATVPHASRGSTFVLALVEQRLQSLKSQIAAAWEDEGCCYELVIEPEVHWRLGKPARPGDSQ